MKKITFILLALLLQAVCLPQVACYAQDITKGHKILVVSHRGDWRNAPENSIQAVKNCIAMGVDMVEIDLKKTKDNQLVIMHDYKIDRTMTGKGKPEDYTLAQLKAMRLRNEMGVPTRHQIPTFKEVMEVAKGKILVNVDKGYDYFKDVLDILKETNTTGQAIIKSRFPYKTVVKDNPGLLDEVEYMPTLDADDPNAETFIADFLKDKRIKTFEVDFKELTPQVQQVLDHIRKSGKQLWFNTLWPKQCGGMDDDRAVELNDKAGSWGQIIKLGARYIQTDRPQALIEYLNETGNR